MADFVITTWNVNGLRAVLKKGALDWLQEKRPDVLCLQEIKTRPEQIDGEYVSIFHGYSSCWNPADRPGYSGVATFCLSDPDELQIGLQEDRFDGEGRVIISRHSLDEKQGFLLFNVYFPNGQRDQGRLQYKLDFYAYLLELVNELHTRGELVVICGDFNTAHREIDLRNPKQNANTSGFLPIERAWIDRYIEQGLVDAYRFLYPDRVQYTWWTFITNARARNVGWRLDYFLVSESLIPRVKDVIIHEEIMGSDHCPVSLILRTG